MTDIEPIPYDDEKLMECEWQFDHVGYATLLMLKELDKILDTMPRGDAFGIRFLADDICERAASIRAKLEARLDWKLAVPPPSPVT